MDETGLNWKRTPDRTLVTKSYSSTKKSKDRIIITLTSNADSSKKFTAQVIRKSENYELLVKLIVRIYELYISLISLNG